MSKLYFRDESPIQNDYKYLDYKELNPALITAAETYNMRRITQDGYGVLEQSLETIQTNSSYQTEVFESGLQSLNNRVQRLDNSVQEGLYCVTSNISRGFHDTVQGLQAVTENMGYNTAVMREGFQNVTDKFDSLTGAVQTGFEVFTTSMQQSFTGVTQAIHASHNELGNRMIQGFQGVSQSLSHHAVIMDTGFQSVVSSMQENLRQQLTQAAHESEHIRQAIGQAASALAEHFSHEAHRNQELTLQCHHELVDVVVQGFTQQMQLIAQHSLVQERTLRQLSTQLGEIKQVLTDIHQVLTHQQRFQANEDFLAGMQYLRHLRLNDAQQQFEKALHKFGGHYQSLLVMGYLQQQFYGDLDKAYDWFHKAYSQAGQDPTHSDIERKAERGFAAMYMARILFTKNDYQAAHQLYKEVYSLDTKFFSALIEGAVCLFFLYPVEEAGKHVRDEFGHKAPCWYALALELSPYFPDHALESLKMALLCDSRTQHPKFRSAKWVWSVLYNLNPRYVNLLKQLIMTDMELSWLLI